MRLVHEDVHQPLEQAEACFLLSRGRPNDGADEGVFRLPKGLASSMFRGVFPAGSFRRKDDPAEYPAEDTRTNHRHLPPTQKGLAKIGD